MLEISFGLVKSIFKDMNMGCTATKFVPCLLSEEQNDNHVNVAGPSREA
jgi:hypothetical protein